LILSIISEENLIIPKKIILILLFIIFSSPNLYPENKLNIAVAEFEGRNVSAMDATVVSDLLRTGLVNTEKFNVVDRANMQQILAEQKFQITGCTSQECAVQMGKLLNVQLIVTGAVTKLGGLYVVTAGMVEVGTSKIIKSGKVTSNSIEELVNKAEELDLVLANIDRVKDKTEKIMDITGKDGVEMVLIPAGEFMMGLDSGDSDERPFHKVYLDTYYIDKYEVTFEQYDKFCEATDRGKPGDNDWGRGNMPVINVTWNDAVAYAEWAGKRLPTEAEWEKACRAGSTGKYCFGDSESELGDYAWYYGNSGNKTHPVGQKKPNKWRIYDMHGNVWEWCSDWYKKNYYKNSPYKNPKGPDSGSVHVLRSGGCFTYANTCHSAFRGWSSPVNSGILGGFRCAASGAQ